MKNLIVLGIESSCDETAASVYTTEGGSLSNEIFSQIEALKKHGGVIPEVVSRTHVEKILPIVQAALDKANVTLDDIDAIAVTNKPGLPGSLLVGVYFAKSIAYAKNIPIIGVNHLEGHAFSSFLEHTPPFPHICLTASGGHTSMYYITDFGKYKVIGQTIDDAAGEAFDKIARLVGLPYPGGPIIEKLAREANFEDFFNYPRSKKKTLDFSFSGIKTAVLYDMVKRGFYDLKNKKLLNDDMSVKQQVASSILVAIKDVFLKKLKLALDEYPDVSSVSFVGGVACNKYIKTALDEFCTRRGIKFFSPSPRYCTDNAAMIAFVGHYKAQRGEFDNLDLDIL